jgi:hypothetical protein
METAGNRINIMILDACRNNPFARSFRATYRGLARVDAPKGSIVSYATSPGSVAAEGSGRNGLYTAKLLKHMMTPGLPVELFFKDVRVDVVNATGGSQIPWTESSLIGDFHFVIEEKAAVTQKPPSKKNEELEKEKARLEKERQELERLRLELERKKLEEERSRVQAEKQKLETASLPPEPVKRTPPSGFKEIGREGHFIAYSNGIVYDRETGLEWVIGPEKNTSWEDARAWVGDLSIDGGNWRMPTMEELKTLYKNGQGLTKLNRLLRLNITRWIWSKDKKYRNPLSLNLNSGRPFRYRPDYHRYTSIDRLGGFQAFAVRSRDQESKTDQPKENIAR